MYACIFKHQKITLKYENLRCHCFRIVWDIQVWKWVYLDILGFPWIFQYTHSHPGGPLSRCMRWFFKILINWWDHLWQKNEIHAIPCDDMAKKSKTLAKKVISYPPQRCSTSILLNIYPSQPRDVLKTDLCTHCCSVTNNWHDTDCSVLESSRYCIEQQLSYHSGHTARSL